MTAGQWGGGLWGAPALAGLRSRRQRLLELGRFRHARLSSTIDYLERLIEEVPRPSRPGAAAWMGPPRYVRRIRAAIQGLKWQRHRVAILIAELEQRALSSERPGVQPAGSIARERAIADYDQ